MNLFDLFQIVDSFFPSGAFAHSWGLETYVVEGIIKDKNGLQRFLEAYLKGSIACCDALVLKLSFEVLEREDINTIFRLDRLINSMKLARESREASIKTGRQLLKVMRALHGSMLLERLSEGIEAGKAYGHQPVVFATVCNVLEINIDEALQAYIYQIISNIVSAGVRLIPLGSIDGQRVIEAMKPLVVKLSLDIALLNETDISSFAPGIEIRAMRHENLYTRLFRS